MGPTVHHHVVVFRSGIGAVIERASKRKRDTREAESKGSVRVSMI